MKPELFTDKWTQMRDEVKQRWSKLTDEDLSKVEGKLDELTGLVQERYDYSREKAVQEVERFLNGYNAKLQAATENVLITAEQTVSEYPWRVILAALCLGFVLGLLFQSSRRKNN
jgi:uncharacterized protein YjbJ (UPF0337 family)